MTKRIISILIASLMLITIIPLSTASAESKYFLCDVNNDSKITAADARLTLRYSVELETFADHQIFSADCAEPIGKITAADARLILRISVELDSVPVHTCNFTRVKILVVPTCTTEGEKELFCDCGNSYIEKIPANGHKNTTTLPGKPATCKEVGLTDGIKCLDCETVIQVQQATKKAPHNYKETINENATAYKYGKKTLKCTICGYSFSTRYAATNHTYSNTTITAETGIKCTNPSCCGKEIIPSFNTLVNKIKSETHTFKSFQKTMNTSSKADIKAGSLLYEGMAAVFRDMLEKEVPATNETVYTELNTIARYITNKNYPLIGTSVVSTLKDTDINNITTSVVDLKSDFLDKLPSSYTASNGTVVDLTSIKNTASGNVLKVSVEVIPENSTIANPPSETAPATRIAYANLSSTIREFSKELDFANLAGDDAAISRFMSSDINATSTCVVDYYFKIGATPDDYRVIAAKYNSSADMKTFLNIFFDDDGNRQEKPTLTISIDADYCQENYFFFTPYFK